MTNPYERLRGRPALTLSIVCGNLAEVTVVTRTDKKLKLEQKMSKETKRVGCLFLSETRHVTVRLRWKTSAETHAHSRFTSKCNKKYTYFQAIVGVKASLLSRRT